MSRLHADARTTLALLTHVITSGVLYGTEAQRDSIIEAHEQDPVLN